MEKRVNEESSMTQTVHLRAKSNLDLTSKNIYIYIHVYTETYHKKMLFCPVNDGLIEIWSEKMRVMEDNDIL